MNLKCETRKIKKDPGSGKDNTPSSADRKKSLKLGKSPSKKSADFLNKSASEGSPTQKINKDINDVVTSKLPHIVSALLFSFTYYNFSPNMKSAYLKYPKTSRR